MPGPVWRDNDPPAPVKSGYISTRDPRQPDDLPSWRRIPYPRVVVPYWSGVPSTGSPPE